MIALHDLTKVYTLSQENKVLAVDRVRLEIERVVSWDHRKLGGIY